MILPVTLSFERLSGRRSWKTKGYKAMFKTSKLVYAQLECEKCEDTNMRTYTVCGRRVHLPLLFMVVILVLSCACAEFWSEFLVKDVPYCDTTMDCFALALNYSLTGIIRVTENCSDYENGDYTISCFKFVFDYATALGNVGGVLVLAAIIINVQTGLWSGALSCSPSCKKASALAGVSILYVLGIIFTIFVAVPTIATVPLFEPIIDTKRNILKFIAYLLTFLAVFTVSGPIFACLSCSCCYAIHTKKDIDLTDTKYEV